MSSFDYDDSSPSWRAIYRDVDLTYGNVRGTPSDTGTLFRYRRIIKAEFLKYRPAEAATEKKEATSPAAEEKAAPAEKAPEQK